MKRQNKTNRNKGKKEQKTKKLGQASIKGRTITVHIEMEKRTGKVALEIKNGHFTFWKNVYFPRHLASSGPIRYIWKTLFFSIILSNTPEAVDWVSFVSLKMFCSPIHNLDLPVLASVFILLCDSFTQNVAPHWEFWINIGYWTTLWTQKIRNTQLPLSSFYYVILHFHYNV